MFQKLRDSALFKVALLLVLFLLLCIPLAQVENLTFQRGESRAEAAAELAQTWAGEQTLAGPLLLVPVTERWTEDVRDANGATRVKVPQSKTRMHAVFPERLSIDGAMEPRERYRGIFRVLFYRLAGRIEGSFAPFDSKLVTPSVRGATLEVGVPVAVLSVTDVRGLEGLPAISLGGESLKFGERVPEARNLPGVQVPLSGAALAAWREGKALPFALDIAMAGQARLAVLPVADETTAHLSSGWPHPSFGGRFLATERQIGAAGFDARWNVSSLVSAARAQLVARIAGAEVTKPMESFDVTMVQPLDVYALSTRAGKYGALFIGLVIMAVFMSEVLGRLRLHPLQYALVGLSIALFFLMLLALSEKIAFWRAYASAASASVLLLGAYFSAVLGGARRGLPLAAFVGVLYAALYGLVVSEQNALLLGSLLLFAMVAALMIATRKVDWYALGGGPVSAAARAT